MRKIITIALFTVTYFLFVNSSRAQGNLQFNQIVLVGSSTLTVPAGKIWKIESVLSGNNFAQSNSCASYNSGSGDYGTAIYINGVLRFPDRSAYEGGSYYQIPFSGSHGFPFWLPTGTSLATFCATTAASVIEFNIVP